MSIVGGNVSVAFDGCALSDFETVRRCASSGSTVPFVHSALPERCHARMQEGDGGVVAVGTRAVGLVVLSDCAVSDVRAVRTARPPPAP